MTKTVSIIVQLQDKFSRNADKINSKFGKMQSGAERATAATRKFGASLAKLRTAGAISTAAITAPIALAGKNMIDAASDAQETANKFNEVFDTVGAKANQTADQFADTFRVAGSTARKLIGDTGDLLVGFGFEGGDALEMSRQVNELAADLVSFQNIEGGAQAASSALTKALLGETESAKSLGIVIRQTTKEFKDSVKHISASRGVSEQMAKSIAILKIAQEQSTKAIGDSVRTQDDYASVVRANAEATKQLAESFGKVLLPMATRLSAAISRVLESFNGMSDGGRKFTLVVAAIAAAAGPVLLVLGSIGAAIAFISAPIAIASAGVIALGAAGLTLAANWDTVSAKFTAFSVSVASSVNSATAAIGGFFSGIGDVASLAFSGITAAFDAVWAGIAATMNKGIRTINKLPGISIPELQAKASEIKLPSLQVQMPSAPEINAMQGVLTGNINVSATPGTQVNSTSIRNEGKNLNMGVNLNG